MGGGSHPWGAEITKGLVKPETIGAPILLWAFFKGSEVKIKFIFSDISVMKTAGTA